MANLHRFCPGCGHKADEGSTFCGECGRSLAKPTGPADPPAAAPAPKAAPPTTGSEEGRTVFDLSVQGFGVPSAATDATSTLTDALKSEPAPVREEPARLPLTRGPRAEPKTEPSTTPFDVPFDEPAEPKSKPSRPAASAPAREPAPPTSPAPSSLGLLRPFVREDGVPLRWLGLAGLVLFASRFIPTHTNFAGTYWAWSGDGETVFRMMVFPIIAALVYAGLAFGPPHVVANVPRGVRRGAPFVFALLGAALFHLGTPISALMRGGGLVAWFYPFLLLGAVGLARRPDDGASKVLLALGGLFTFIGGMIGVSQIFAFGQAPALLIVHNLLYFVVLLAALGAVVLAIPESVWPDVAKLARFAPLCALVFTVWPFVAAFLFAMVTPGISKLTVLLHVGAGLFGFLWVLLASAPHALDGLRSVASKLQTPHAPAE